MKSPARGADHRQKRQECPDRFEYRNAVPPEAENQAVDQRKVRPPSRPLQGRTTRTPTARHVRRWSRICAGRYGSLRPVPSFSFSDTWLRSRKDTPDIGRMSDKDEPAHQDRQGDHWLSPRKGGPCRGKDRGDSAPTGMRCGKGPPRPPMSHRPQGPRAMPAPAAFPETWQRPCRRENPARPGRDGR